MNAEIASTVIKLVSRLTREVQGLPRELLEQMLREQDTALRTVTMPESVKVLHDDGVVRLRLLLQWHSQATEQLLNEAEFQEASARATPDLVTFLMGGGPR